MINYMYDWYPYNQIIMIYQEILMMAGNRTWFFNNESNKLDEYEYDVTESLVHYDWAELIPTVVVYSIVLLIGIFGNG